MIVFYTFLKNLQSTSTKVCTFFLTLFMLFIPLFKGIASPIQIEIWDFPRWLEPGEKVDRFKWISRKILEFEQKNPDIKVKLTKLTWKRGGEKLKISALGGSHPDVAPGTVPLLFIKEGLIAPIDNYLTEADKQDYLQSALNAFKVDKKIYGWPWYMGGSLLYLNKQLFKEAEVSLPENGRWTPEEFYQTLIKLRTYFNTGTKQNQTDKPADNSNKKSLTSKGYYPLGIYFQKDKTANFPFAKVMGGKWIDSNKQFAGNTPAMVSGLNWLKKLKNEGFIPKDSGGKTEGDIWTAFGREHRLAIAAFGLWGIRALSTKYPMDFTVAHYPARKGKLSGAYLGISGYYVFKNRNPQKVAAAMKLSKFLTNAQSQKELYKYTQFPTRKSTGNIYEDNKPMSRAWQILQEGQTVFPDNRWAQIDEEIETSVQELLLDKVDTQTAMDNTAKAVNRILKHQSGSIHADLQKGSWAGKIFLILFVISIFFAIAARQVHLLFIIPAITFIGLFLFYPLADAIILAFRNYRIGEVGGFTTENFTRAITDKKFIQACYNTALYTFIVVPANVFTALVVSSLIYNLTGKVKNFFRAAYYLPGVASVVVLTMVWRWIFNTEVGLFNSILKYFEFAPIGWITDPDIAFGSIILAGILKSPGGAMLIYLASLGNIPTSLYESAELEGASELQKWWHITVPLLRTTTTFLIITGTIASLQVFAQVLMLTDGGPGISTEVVVHRVYTSAFRDFDFGLSSAMALMLFIVIMIITIIQRRLTSKDMEYLA